MKEKKLNIEYIRVFAMFFTVMIHVANVYRYKFLEISNFNYFISLLYNSFARICVPLFFMISGMLLINEEFNFKKYFKRIGKFVLILVFWNFVYYFSNHYNDLSGTFSSFLISSLFNTDMTEKHLWFMYAIIALYIALPFIQNMCKNMTVEQENLFVILWGILSGFSFLYLQLAENALGHVIKITYPIPIINGTYYLGYFVLGHILYKRFKNFKMPKKGNIFCVLLYFIVSLVIAFMTYFCSFVYNVAYDNTLWYRGIFTIIATSVIFILFIVNEHKFNNKNILKLSKCSFGVYLIHMLFLNLIDDYIVSYSPIIIIPLLTFGLYVFSLIICYIIKKIPIIRNLI